MSKVHLSKDELSEIQRTTSLTEAQVLRLHKSFVKLDRNNTGYLSWKEFSSTLALESNPLVGRVFMVMDMNGDKNLHFTEFVKAFSVFSYQADKKEKLHFAFKMYDIDGDGKISNKDLYQALRIMVGANLTAMQLQQIVDKTFIEVDTDRDGYITFENFETLANSGHFLDRLNLNF
ncbi:unnamed protein product [Phytomonas sp. Hart1]|nr:unnamed protein product [Phytomonas sp. Hart1]|eukprot:CCW70383.1 unnamed protein product [Phytomonas sp. isolate Hart1]